MKNATDMRFGVIRDKSAKSEKVYKFDGGHCHVCNLPTEVSEDSSRRYCSNEKCNALIVQEV